MQYKKWNQQLTAYEESAVYRVSTGERVPCYPIDGREMVASGEYSYTAPTEEQMAAAQEGEAADAEDPEPVQIVAQPLPPAAPPAQASTAKKGPRAKRKP